MDMPFLFYMCSQLIILVMFNSVGIQTMSLDNDNYIYMSENLAEQC